MNDKKKRYITMAISSWEDKANGVYRWWEKDRHTKEYCLSQIEFFKKMK